MKIVMAFLLFAAIVNANIMDGRTQVDPTHPENTVLNGKDSYRLDHKYVASVQLNGSHICSSGMFGTGFLLTTGECAWHLGRAIKKGERWATAVFANPSSKDGQRIDIYKVAYCLRYDNHEDDVGVIMLVKNYDQTHMSVLNTYPKNVDLRRHGTKASVCGWATGDSPNNAGFEEAKVSYNLYCMEIELYSEGRCYKDIPFGNFKHKLLCGRSNSPMESRTVEDFGSPVTKIIYNADADGNVIVGVTIRPYVHGNVTLHQFIKISLVFDDMQAMVKELESQTEADKACMGENQYSMGISNERPKHQ